ncbi:MAG: methyltransferase domain-containing protein, partial [Thermodesulfobacteriota bacterium]
MQRSTKDTVLDLLAAWEPRTILDCPSGNGWLAREAGEGRVLDGLDLYETSAQGYRRLEKHDLDQGLPGYLDRYDCLVCCEGLEHLANPELFLRTARGRLNPGGRIIITTPNTYYAMSRL